MDQICSSDVLLKNAIKKVVELLEDGLRSINRVYKALIDGDADPAYYSYIREQIDLANQSLQQSEQAASSGLKSVDENIEILTQDEGRLEKEKKDTEQTLDNLRTEQEFNNKLLKQSEDFLDSARRHLRSARDTLERLEQRKRKAVVASGVGTGLLTIPIVGWVAGGIMVVDGLAELGRAKHAINVAIEEKKEAQSEVDRLLSKVSDYNSKISQTERKISQKHDQVGQIRKKIPKLTEQKTAVAELQEKVRKAVHILSVLSGRASVVECQTRKFISLEPVMKVMEDVMKSAGDIGGSQLLYDRAVPQLLDRMRENNRNLAEDYY